MFSPFIVMQYLLSFLVCNRLYEEERAGCFAFVAFSVLWLFLVMLRVGLQHVIVIFPGHTHLHF